MPLLCNFCNKRETRTRRFNLPFTCKDCEQNEKNYARTVGDDIIYVNSSGKYISVSSDTEISIEMDHNTNDTNVISGNSRTSTEKRKPINSNDFKDALLASLYSQVELLRDQLKEKDLLIRTLIIRDGEIETYGHATSNYAQRKKTSQSETNESEGEEENDSVFVLDCVNSASIDSDTEEHQANSDGNEGNETTCPEEVEQEPGFSDLYLQSVRDTEEERIREGDLEQQLLEVRAQRHFVYCHSKGIPVANVDVRRDIRVTSCNEKLPDEIGNEQRNDKIPWSKGTVLIMGDSTLNGVQEALLGPRFKVRAHPGAIVRDFYHHAVPLLEKKPTYVIIMAGTNDSTMKSSELILVELLQLKTFIEKQLPGCTVIISCPTDRNDDPKAKLTNLHIRRKLNNLKLPIIVNDNITEVHIGKRGLHLNGRGSGRLAANFLSYMRQH